MDKPIRSLNGKPIFWEDSEGITHRCEYSDIHSGIRLVWTDCQRDVPANGAFICGDGTATVDCPGCIYKIAPELLR